MSEDPRKMNLEDFKQEGSEIPDFGFDRKMEEGGGLEIQEEKGAKEEVSGLPQEKFSGQTSAKYLQKSSGIQAIENILEEDLGDVYFNLTPQKQKEFKKKGEETAVNISLVLKKANVKIKKLVKLIRDWLKLIPGVNKFFLEQEAKIKADKIIELKNKE